MKFVVLGLILVILATTGCVTSVGRIADDPDSYSGQVMKIKGEAGKGFTIPLTEIYVFLLKGKEASVPVVAMNKADQGSIVVIEGTVWAFPEEGMNAGSIEAVDAVQAFLIDHELVSEKRARDASALVLTAVGKLAAGLGNIWFVIEAQ